MKVVGQPDWQSQKPPHQALESSRGSAREQRDFVSCFCSSAHLHTEDLGNNQKLYGNAVNTVRLSRRSCARPGVKQRSKNTTAVLEQGRSKETDHNVLDGAKTSTTRLYSIRMDPKPQKRSDMTGLTTLVRLTTEGH